jgi:hypothetical protein
MTTETPRKCGVDPLVIIIELKINLKIKMDLAPMHKKFP